MDVSDVQDSSSDKEEFSDDDQADGVQIEEDESNKLREELADIPLGELQKLKETIGLKKYNEALFGKWKPQSHVVNEESECDDNEIEAMDNKKPLKNPKFEAKKKESKSAPVEKSSKLKSFKARKVIENVGRKKRDPRFDEASGQLNEDLFKKSYSFVDDIKKQETNTIRKNLRKTKSKDKKEHLTKLLQRIEHKDKIETLKEKRQQDKRKRKNEESNSVTSNKKPFYLKNSDKKKIELAEKYRELKKTGQLDKYLSKKYKKNASKEKKNLPNL